MYRITFKKGAIKELQRLPSFTVKNISRAINKLAENPRPDGCKKLVDSKENMWRIRVGDYRVLYVIEDKIQIVDIRRIGHRKDIYR
ncbi:MAG: type II toxin-antitoxin system RelE family toxin [Bacteroidia bacterium]